MKVEENAEIIKKNIMKACQKAGRDPQEITIIAVTKYVTIERANEAIAAGITNLGENRLEGFKEKFSAIENKATWHFIGSLQSRKVKELAAEIDCLHSLDRKSLAKELNKRLNSPLSCFVQVNTSGEESKHGLQPEDVMEFVENMAIYNHLKIDGLMTMAPLSEDEKMIRNSFRKLRELRDEIKNRQWSHAPCQYLSMGMSNDYQIAIEEGATHIRIGSALVGQSEPGGGSVEYKK